MKASRSFFIGLVIGVSITVVMALMVLPAANTRWYKLKFKSQEEKLKRQEERIGELKQREHSGLLVNVMNLIDKELMDNPSRVLSDETISRIVSMCFAAKPYVWPEGDTASVEMLSPERGQLLLFLSGMKLDSVTFQKIKQEASFAGADLRNAKLSGVDLRGIHLERANLKGADLHDANLSGANLRLTNLWGADLSKANLYGANLQRANLSWSTLNHADMRTTDLTEADVVAAQIKNADLRGSNLRWVDFSGSFLNEAILANSDLFRATMTRAQLAKADLSSSILTYVILSEANLNETNLAGADLTNLIIAEKDWLSLLDVWKIKEAKEIQSRYKMIEAFSYDGSKYQLVAKQK